MHKDIRSMESLFSVHLSSFTLRDLLLSERTYPSRARALVFELLISKYFENQYDERKFKLIEQRERERKREREKWRKREKK